MWKLNFNIQEAATVATPATEAPFPDHTTESVATVAVVAGGDIFKKAQYPPLPKSVYAALDYLRRTKFEKPLTPKLEAWVKSDKTIEAYERTIDLLHQKKNSTPSTK